MKAGAIVLNFSGIYEQESFYRSDKSSHFVDLSDISGTNCMCDEAAKEEIIRRIKEVAAPGEAASLPAPEGACCGGFLPYGLHFVDNGNYHYMSSLYLSLVKEPFSLIVLDHHPDMQRPMFDILSCGGWIADVLDNNEFVMDVHIIGADPGLVKELEEEDRKKVTFYNIEEIFEKTDEGYIKVHLPESSFPIYLSIDKDVIRREELTTNWDQGEAERKQVLELVRMLTCGTGRLIGVDICGECAPDQEDCDLDRAIAENDKFNKEVLDIIRAAGAGS